MSSIPNNEILDKMATVLKIAADSTRLKIICAIDYEERSVGEIAELIEASQSLVSHQLSILRRAHLVRVRKEGKKAFYKLDDYHVNALVNIVRDHVLEEA